ncbi:MAG: excinuclease ABC subunit UvrC [Pygmaiobacter massiliensis]|nr:excinuclease ABC subunit UvrC [Pygmaiobacter massiliensis]
MTKAELYEKASKLPLLPGVYIIHDKSGTIIYIGKAKRLRTRVSQYFREGVPHDAKVTKMIEHADSFDFIVTTSEFEALVLECSQIKLHTPKYNILLKDDKGYSYIKVSREPYPRLTAQLQRVEDGSEYIGPYMSSFAVRQMVETANLAFRLPTCGRVFPRDFGKERPCLNAHIGRCMALCTGKISQQDYLERVNGAVRLIKEGKGEILRTLRAQMEQAAERLEFEKAAQLRDQIAAIEKAMGGQRVVQSTVGDADVFSFAAKDGAVCAAMLAIRGGRLVDKNEFTFTDTQDTDAVREELLPRYYENGREFPRRILVDKLPEAAAEMEQMWSQQAGRRVVLTVPQRGDGPRLLQMAQLNAIESLTLRSGRVSKEDRLLDEVAKLLGLEKPPHVIESYDISNWGEGTSVAGMVVFQNARPYRSGYRRFKMKTVTGTDDFASMAETLSRRAAEYEAGASGQFGIKPDLILLDGGKGQLSAAVNALQNTALEDVPIFGLVKDDRHRTRAIVGRDGEEIVLAMHKSVFGFFGSIQEEVHRYSIAYQRQQAKKKTFQSSLTQIPGVGPATAKKLLRQFGGVHAVAQQPCQVLRQAGLSEKTAQAVYRWFHPQEDGPLDKSVQKQG